MYNITHRGEICKCECHEPGARILHFVACCYPSENPPERKPPNMIIEDYFDIISTPAHWGKSRPKWKQLGGATGDVEPE